MDCHSYISNIVESGIKHQNPNPVVMVDVVVTSLPKTY